MKDYLNVSWGRKCASSGVGEEKVMPVPDKPVVLSQLLARGGENLHSPQEMCFQPFDGTINSINNDKSHEHHWRRNLP